MRTASLLSVTLAIMAVSTVSGAEPVRNADLASQLGAVLADQYYDPTRGNKRAELMVKRALRQLEQAEISIDTQWQGAVIEINMAGITHRVVAPAPKTLGEVMGLLDQVRHTLGQGGFTPERTKELGYALLNGALTTLDPHTLIMPPEPAQRFREEISGQFHGIGAYLRDDEQGRVMIDRVMPGRPAERSGVEDGDVILAVDGETTAGLATDQVVPRIKGPKGSTVRLLLGRSGQANPIEVRVVRDVVQILTMRSWRGGDVGYIRMDEFNQITDRDLLKELTKLNAPGDDGENAPIKALVLDLRFNGGGLLDQAKIITDFFLPRGKEIVRVVDFEAKPLISWSSPRRFVNCPVIVLTSADTASASEILAGALQRNDRALVMGVRTYGKGTVQTTKQFDDASQFKFTIQGYQLPGGVSIQDLGVVPDILLRRRMALADSTVDLIPFSAHREADQEAALANVAPYSHSSSMVLAYTSMIPEREALRRSSLQARDYRPDQEAMLAIDLLSSVTSQADFVTAAAAADAKDQGRQFLLERLRGPVLARIESESATLARILASQKPSITWGPAQPPVAGGLSVRYDGPTVLTAGNRETLTFTVRNDGPPQSRLYAMFQTDRESPLWEDELVIGQLASGESRQVSLSFTVPLRATTGQESFVLDVLPDGASAASASVAHVVQVVGLPRPHLAYSMVLNEPAGDGRFDVGEAAEVVLTVRNSGTVSTQPLSLRVGKDNNPFVELGGEPVAKLEAIPAGGSVERRFPVTLNRTAKGNNNDGSPIHLQVYIEEVLPDGQDRRNRLGLVHKAEIPVGQPLQPIANHPPGLSFLGVDSDGRLKLRVEDDNLAYVALFQDEDKIDLASASAMPEHNGARDYRPKVTLKPGMNIVRVLATDVDKTTTWLNLRLVGPGK